MHFKPYLRFAIFMAFLSISVHGFQENNSDLHSISESIRPIAVPENASKSLSKSFVELIKQISVVQVQLSIQMKEMEKQYLELGLKEEVEQQKDQIERLEELLKQTKESIDKTAAELRNKEEKIESRETQVQKKEQSVVQAENETKIKMTLVKEQEEQVKQSKENIEKSEAEMKKREEILKKREEIVAQKENRTCTVSWIRASNGYIPPNAILGAQEGIHKFYVGRAFHPPSNAMILGKIYPMGQSIYISLYGKEYSYKEYEVAVLSPPN